MKLCDILTTVRTALVALIAFMPTNPGGALGSLDYKKEDRRELAIKSREAPPKFGSPERQKLIDEIHQEILSKAPPVPQLPLASLAEHNPVPANPPAPIEASNEAGEVADNNPTSAVATTTEELLQPEEPEGGDQEIIENIHEVRVDAAAGRLRVGFGDDGATVARVQSAAGQRAVSRVQRLNSDKMYTWAAFGLAFAIAILLVKKFVKLNGLAGFSDGI